VKVTLELINQMQADGVIEQYAIGGAIGATLYLEPAATLDVDVFVTLPGEEEKKLLSLSPLYDYLRRRGCRVKDEHIVIGNWPVQFLPPSNELEREAIENSRRTSVEGVRTRVMTAEHLMAIALRTGRAKDHARVLQFVEQHAFNSDALMKILDRHELISNWRRFERKFLGRRP
jgi:hypothetical protein